MTQTCIVGPVKRVSRFDADEVRDWLLRGGAGVLIEETLSPPVIHTVSALTAGDRGRLSNVYMRYAVKTPQGKDLVRFTEPHPHLYHPDITDPVIPKVLVDLVDTDVACLQEVRSDQRRCALFLKDRFKTRFHTDSGARKEYYLHRHLGSSETGMWVFSPRTRCEMPLEFDDRGNTLCLANARQMMDRGEAEAFQLKRGDWIVFNDQMAHGSSPPHPEKFRYLIT